MTQTRKQAQLYGQALAGIRGYGTYGATTKATLYVGRTTGLDTGPVPEGKTIPENTVAATIVEQRIKQVGFQQASSTISTARGHYQGHPEDTLKIEIAYTGADKSPAAFRRNIKTLAQHAAQKLGQREILIEWISGGKRVSTATASPTKAPSPTQRARFCAWVRQHSERARTDPDDACYRAPSKKAKAKR